MAAARGLFNVAPMAKTKDALALLADTLQRSDQDKLYQQFVEEQRKSAEAGAASGKSTVMSRIDCARPEYEEAIKKISGKDYYSQIARGNLYLLCGKAAEARIAMEAAYALKTPQQLGDATENIARVIKAEDGGIGRANAFVLSVRPQASPTAPGS